MIFISCNNKELPTPLVHYSFSSDTADGQGHLRSLENYGAKDTTDRFDHPNGAYYFDGKASSMHIGLHGMPSINNALTVTWWYKTKAEPIFKDSLDAGNMIALVDTTQAIGLQFGYRAPGYGTQGLDVWNWGGRTLLQTQKPALNQWHHCVYTYDGHEHRLFLDGSQVSSSMVSPQDGSPNLLMLGNYPGGTQFFQGTLDEIRVYDQTLTANQVQEQFDRERQQPPQ